jgi:uncharacterized protein (TIGR02266 family)
VAPKVPDQPDTPGGGDERRRSPRAVVDLQVSLRFPSVQQFLSAYAGDISETGMFIRTAEPHRVGEVISLRFEAGKERIVQGTARIVRLVEATAPGERGIGVEFVELDEVSRKLVEMIVRIKLAAG